MIGKSIIISVKAKYKIGQRVSFIAQNKIEVNDKCVIGKWQHCVGYIKQVRRSLRKICYVIIKAKSDDIYIVPQCDIIGIVEKRDNNKSNTTDENGITR